MSVFVSPSRLLGLLLLLSVIGFQAWTTLQRVDRVNRVSSTDAAAAKSDSQSSTGYADERRWLIVPEHHTPSYGLIGETQHMLASGEWRVRKIAHENAPEGRPVYSASCYRWLLGGLAWVDHVASGRSIGQSVERAAVWSEPLLRLVLLVVGGVAIARGFGAAAALAFAVGLTFVFPLAGAFLPALPDDRSLSLLCVLGSVLPLLLACRPGREGVVASGTPQARRLFALAGIAGGLGLWIDAPHQTWVVLGIGLGGALLTTVLPRSGKRADGKVASPMPWRTWAWVGALASVAAYVVEYGPSHLEMRLEVNHPLYALAWLGVGEVLHWLDTRGRSLPRPTLWFSLLSAVVAVLGTASLPVSLAVLRPQEWLSGNLLGSRLVLLPDGAVASSVAAWLKRDGFSPVFAATFLPLLLLIAGVWVLKRPASAVWRRQTIALVLGVLVATLPMAMMQLAWWSTVDVLLLCLLVSLLAKPVHVSERSSGLARALFGGMAAVVIVFGFFLARPPRAGAADFAFSPREAEALLERAAAHWIAERAGPDGAVILTPPARTARWCFHAGPRVRGLGSFAWENRPGLEATFRIAAAQTGEEAQALLLERGITHLVLPSWDEDLRQAAQRSLKDANDAFITAVHQWSLPSWLRPMAYPFPVVPGFEDASIVVLKVTEENNRAPALARMVEFFLETNRPELADAAGQALRQFPADPNALIGLAQLQKARGATKELEQTMEAFNAGLEASFDRGLAWDRRVSLAIVLAQAQQHERAQEQLQRCLDRLDENRLLELSPGALYRLQVLARGYDKPIRDPALRAKARQLLPEPLQRRLDP